MSKKIFLALMVVVFFSCVYSQATPPKIIDLNIYPKKAYYDDGELVTISAVSILDENEKEDANYFWSFGDGTAIAGNFPKVYHVFYLDSNIPLEQRFTITLKLSTKSGSDTKSTTIAVRRGRAKVVVQYPQDMTAFNKKDYILRVFFTVLDSRDYPINSYLRDMNIFIGKTSIEKIPIGEQGFEIKIPPSNTYSTVEFLEINAMRGSTLITGKIPFYFEPLQISISSYSLHGKSIYIGENIGTVSFCLVYPNGESVSNGTFYVELIKGEASIQKSVARFNDGCFFADFNYFITIKDFEEANLQLMFYGKDSYQNILSPVYRKINVSKDNPSFDLVLLRPTPLSNNTFGFLQNIRIETTLNQKLGIASRDVNVFLAIPALNIYRQLYALDSTFMLDFEVPMIEIKNADAKIVATVDVNNVTYSDIETFKVTFTKEIKISFVYPSEKGKTQLSEDGRILVELRYPDDSLLKEEKVSAMLYIDKNYYDIQLVRDYNKGYYYYAILGRLVGKHIIKLDLKEPFYGSKEITAEIEEPLNLLLIAIVLSIVVSGVIFIGITIKRAKYKNERRKILINRLSNIELEMKENQSALFSRRISVEEYKSRMLVLQNEMDSIERELKGSDSFSFNFLKGLFSKLKAKKEIKTLPKETKPETATSEAEKDLTKEIKEKEPELELKKELFDTKQVQFPEEKSQTINSQQLIVPEWPKPPVISEASIEIPEEIVPLFPEKKPLTRAEKPAQELKGQIITSPPKAVISEPTEIKTKEVATREDVQKQDKEIQKPKEEIKELVKKASVNIYASKAIEKEQVMFTKEEEEIIKKLCALLKPAVKLHKPGEIYRALIEEGYKPYIALAVVERLFEIK
ncbi:MAG: hypothetical protein QXM75_03390 [Candidatus Diapherotrites archaeon]